MTIKKFFYQNIDETYGFNEPQWMLECTCDNIDYTKSTEYNWFKTNLIGRWEVDTAMRSLTNGESLYVIMYDRVDAFLVSGHHKVPMPVTDVSLL